MLAIIKSIYILKKVFENVEKNRYLQILHRNKNLQKRLNLSLDTYKEYYNQIEIEIIPKENIDEDKNIFINESKVFDGKVYFNTSFEKGEKRYYFNKNENITKIRLLMNTKGEPISLSSLFENVQCIKEVKVSPR